jgi:hypothetical protein
MTNAKALYYAWHTRLLGHFSNGYFFKWCREENVHGWRTTRRKLVGLLFKMGVPSLEMSQCIRIVCELHQNSFYPVFLLTSH